VGERELEVLLEELLDVRAADIGGLGDLDDLEDLLNLLVSIYYSMGGGDHT
jgi:hypothetical protein